MGKRILLTWLDPNVMGQNENFKMDIINVIFTTASKSSIFNFYF